MKNLIVLFVLVLFASFYSCKDDFQSGNKSSHDLSNTGKRVVVDDLINWNENLFLYDSGIQGEHNYFEAATNYFEDSGSQEKITKLYQTLTGSLSTPNSVVFYLSETPAQLTSLSRENIFAVSSFTIENNKLKHKLHVQKGNELLFAEYDYFGAEVRSVTTNVPNFLIADVLKPLTGKELSYLFITGKTDYTLNEPVNEFQLKSTGYARNLAIQRDVPWVGIEAARCGSPCGQNEKGECEVYEEGLNQCVVPSCGFREIEEVMYASSSIPVSVLDVAFDADLLHDLEENFLEASTTGTKYVNYFYSLSAYLVEDFDLAISIKTAMLLPQVNVAAQKLLNPIAHANDVLVDANFAADLKSLLDDYRTISKVSGYLEVLNDIQTDIDKYKGLSVAQVVKIM